MKQTAEAIFNHFLPSAEDLWERGGADMRTKIDNDGHEVTRPFFDLEVSEPKQIGKPERFVTKHSKRDLGTVAVHQFEVNGVDYLTRAFVPDDRYRTDYDFTITSGTAWTTTINGYALDRSRKLFADTTLPVLQVGPPHSGRKLSGPLEFLRVPDTVEEAQATSLARTAQVEQALFAALSRLYDLPQRQLPIGDSRDANTTPGQFEYAKDYGAELIGFDNKGRCAPYKMELKDMPRFVNWLASTALGGVAVATCLAKEGQLQTLAGTTSLNPNFWASTLTGTLQALASGETREMIDWVPRDTHGIDVLYGHDMSYIDDIIAAWAQHPNVHTKLIHRGTHAALLHPLAHKGRRERISQLAFEHREHRGNLAAMNWQKIHGIRIPPVDQAA